MSTSQAKVDAFGNENKVDDGDAIVQFEFSSSLVEAFKANLRPHQMKGVQRDTSAVALHREGFAEIGNLHDIDRMEAVLNANKNYNLGFTALQYDRLKALLKSATKIAG